ncbi:hypothetical protein [Streptomyces sp. NPDC059631]|uniref:restriction endonuclease subunit S n=1 Tax=unclassified Streptomyces TaxID=2593676 RepID=UPI0036931391
MSSAANGTWGSDPVGDASDVRCIRATDFDRTARRALLDRAPLRSVDAKSLRKYLLRPGDLILEKSGGGEKQPVGMAVLFAGAEAAVCSNFCARVTPAEGTDPRFLVYVLAAAYGQGLTQSAIKQTTGIQNLDSGAFFSSAWAYPELDEQCRIADFLDAEIARIDRLVSAREKQVAALDEREYAEVTDGLIPGSLTVASGKWPWAWLPASLEDAPLVRLGYIARIQSGLTVDGKRDLSGDVVTRPYLRVANVQADRIQVDNVTDITVPADIAKRSTLLSGDVLMTEGGDLDKLGRGTVWRGELAGCLHQNHVFAVRPDPLQLDADYLSLMTRTMHGRCYFESTGVKTTNLASTNSSKILGFPIPLPKLEIQQLRVRVVQRKLEGIGRAKGRLRAQLELLAERRQTLITAAVTGQLDVTTARPAHDRDL